MHLPTRPANQPCALLRFELLRKTVTSALAAALLSLTAVALVAAPAHAQTAPSVSAVAVTSDAGSDSTYELSDTIRVQVTFSEAVTVTGTPRLQIDMDPAHWGKKWASYEGGSGTTQLTFTYTVVRSNISKQGIAVLANTLQLNGGTIRSASNVNATLTHTGLAHDASHKVDWRLTSEQPAGTPTVDAVAVTSDAGSNQTYGRDDTIQVQLTFSEAVTVTGTPQVAIDMHPHYWGKKWADYASGSGTTQLTFNYTVVQVNSSEPGIAVLANSLRFNGGTIKSSSSVDAYLGHAGLAHDRNHMVDGRLPPAAGTPAVSAVAVTSSAGSDSTYELSDTIRVQLTFSEAVTVTGTPRLRIDMDPAHWGKKWANYEGGSGTTQLTFTHTVVRPNISKKGIAVLASTLQLNGGTIQSASNTDAVLAHDGLDHDANHKVDWTLTSTPAAGTPTVSAVAVASNAGADQTYKLGDTIQVRLTFSEAVTVTGTPQVAIDMHPHYWGKKWADYQSGSGTTQLTFSYTVVRPNKSTPGIAVLKNSLRLNGGTIQSSANVDTHLGHAGLAHDPNHKVNWQQP